MDIKEQPKRNFVDKMAGVVYINGIIDDTILTDVIPDLDEVIAIKSSLADPSLKQIEFRITSNGGDCYILLALLDVIKEAKNNGIIVRTNIRGYADSCASMLAICGTKGFRSCGLYSRSVVHHFSGARFVSSESEIDRIYKNQKRLSKDIKNMYLENTKLKAKDYDDIVTCDHYEMDAQEMLKKGFVDFIVGA